MLFQCGDFNSFQVFEKGVDLDCLQVLKTGWGGVTLRDSPYISFYSFYRPIQEYLWLRVGDLNRLQVLKHEG